MGKVLVALGLVAVSLVAGCKSSDETGIAPPPPLKPGEVGALVISEKTDDALTLSWTAPTLALVNESSALSYRVYSSAADNLQTVADIETNGTLVSTESVTSPSLRITGLSAGRYYFFNVVVSDDIGNKASYRPIRTSVGGLVINAPVAGGSGAIQVSSVTSEGAVLSWAAAIRNPNDTGSLHYRVYRSSADNISTAAAAEGNGEPMNASTIDLTTLPVWPLPFSTTYYFNVVVTDDVGNKTAYARAVVTTLARSWVSLGSPTNTITKRSAMVIGSDNKPVVASKGVVGISGGGTNDVYVRKWDTGTTWTSLGSPGVATGSVGLALDPSDGKPIVFFADTNNGNRPTAKKWSSGTIWNLVGGATVTNSAVGLSGLPGIAVDANSVITVIFSDNSNSDYLTAYRFVSGSWTSAGVIDAWNSDLTRIAVGADNLPLVVFTDQLEHPVAKKWSSGTTWTELGTPAGAPAPYFRLCLDNDGAPVVSLGDDSGSFAAVARWTSGTTWASLGNSGEGQVRQAPVAVDRSDNLPVMLYIPTAGESPKLKKSDGTAFADLGPNPIVVDRSFIDESQLVLDSENRPIVYVQVGEDSSIGGVFILR